MSVFFRFPNKQIRWLIPVAIVERIFKGIYAKTLRAKPNAVCSLAVHSRLEMRFVWGLLPTVQCGAGLPGVAENNKSIRNGTHGL
jgi:hypothetical protein